MRKNKLKFISLGIALLVFFEAIGLIKNKNKFINPNRINNFEAYVDAGYAVRESYPR